MEMSSFVWFISVFCSGLLGYVVNLVYSHYMKNKKRSIDFVEYSNLNGGSDIRKTKNYKGDRKGGRSVDEILVRYSGDVEIYYGKSLTVIRSKFIFEEGQIY